MNYYGKPVTDVVIPMKRLFSRSTHQSFIILVVQGLRDSDAVGITHSGSARAGAPRARAWHTVARQVQAHMYRVRTTKSGSARAGALRARVWHITARRAQALFAPGPPCSHLLTHVLTSTRCIHILALLELTVPQPSLRCAASRKAVYDVVFVLSRHGAARRALGSDFRARWDVVLVNKQSPTDCLSLCALGPILVLYPTFTLNLLLASNVKLLEPN